MQLSDRKATLWRRIISILTGAAVLLVLWYFLWPYQGLTHETETAFPTGGSVSVQLLQTGERLSFRFASGSRFLKSVGVYVVTDPEHQGGTLSAIITDENGAELSRTERSVQDLVNADWNSYTFEEKLNAGQWYWMNFVLESESEDAMLYIAQIPQEELTTSYQTAAGTALAPETEGIPQREGAMLFFQDGREPQATGMAPLTTFQFEAPVSDYVRGSILFLAAFFIVVLLWIRRETGNTVFADAEGDSSFSTSPGRLKLPDLMVLSALCIQFLLLIPNIVYHMTNVNLDMSWRYFLNIANEERIIFGKDVFFTYGPLGYLCYMMNKGHDLQYWVGIGIWAAVFCMHLLLLKWITDLHREGKISLLSVLLSAIVTFTLFSEPVQENYLEYVLLLSVVVYDRGRKKAAWITNLLLVLVFFCKFSAFTGGLAFLILYILYRTVFARDLKSMILLAPALAAAPVSYLAYNPNPRNLIDYVSGILKISSGWMKTQQWDDSFTRQDFVSFFVILAAYLLIIAIVMTTDIEHAGILLACGAPMFMAYKYGVTAHGLKPAIWMTALFFSCAFLSIPVNEIRYKNSHNWKPALGMISLMCVLITGLQAERLDANFGQIRKSAKDKIYTLTHLNEVTVEQEQIRQSCVIPESFLDTIGGSTVTAYPWETGYRSIYPQLHVVYSPSVQNCNEFIPWLDQLSAKYFIGEQAPEFIILKDTVIYGHIKYLENPLTWEAIRNAYSVVDRCSGEELTGNPADSMLLLKKDKKVSDGTAALIFAETGKPLPEASGLDLSQSGVYNKYDLIEVPAGTAYAMFHADYTLPGKIKDFFWRAGTTQLWLEYTDGTIRQGNIVYTNLISGMTTVLLPDTLQDVETVLNSDSSGQPMLQTLQFTGTGMRCWEDEIRIDWYKLTP